MTRTTFDLPAEVQDRLALQGADGDRWIRALPSLVAELEAEWNVTVGAVLSGGSEACVASATSFDGADVVLKLGIPGPTGFDNETCALLLAEGRGYARMLRHDTSRRALLLERLGPQLAHLGHSIRVQIEIICATLRRAWITVPDDAPLPTGAEKARGLGAFIAATWEEQGRPCSERAITRALEFSEARMRAFEHGASVLVHGDAHNQNTLQVRGAVWNDIDAFKFVDPDGMRGERALDLAVPMRDWSEELLAGDALALGMKRCEFISALTGVAPEPIWQWGFLERVSTGLHVLQLGWHEIGAEMLHVADAWAE